MFSRDLKMGRFMVKQVNSLKDELLKRLSKADA